MKKTIFLLGGTGFIGEQTLHHLQSENDIEVLALARSEKSARKIKVSGATPIPGDMLEPGEWQKKVSDADIVIHIAQPETFGVRITKAIAKKYEATRLAMDQNLFEALSKERKTKLVYVAGNSYYGETGIGEPKDENMKPCPTGFGPYITKAVSNAESLHGFNKEVIVAFPVSVYGQGSWLKQYFLDPISLGKPVMQLPGPSHWISPIHVDDCGRALVHLALRVKAGLTNERFFLVDDKPITYKDIAKGIATILNKPLKIKTIPGFLLGLFAGQIIRSYMETDSKYSNTKLKLAGFEFIFPSFEKGLKTFQSE